MRTRALARIRKDSGQVVTFESRISLIQYGYVSAGYDARKAAVRFLPL